MKKYLAFLICLVVLNACDDGEMTFDTFDFSEVQASNCSNNNLIYKVNGNEALVLQINSTATNDIFPFRNVIGTKTIPLNNSNKVFYRTFSGDINGSSYFCSTIPPASPTVTSEYATSDTGNGIIEITTTLIPSTTTLANAKYLHSIILRNVTFTNSQGGVLIFDELNFGTYSTVSSVEFAFSNLTAQHCSVGTGNLFKVIDTNLGNIAGTENLNKFLEINIPVSMFPTQSTEVRKVFLSETDGVNAIYRVYNGDVENEDYCGQVETLSKQEEWKANEGVNAPQDADDQGYFEISASTDPDTGSLVFNITLKKFSFTRAFPIDPTGAPAGTFTSVDVNFGTISLPTE